MARFLSPTTPPTLSTALAITHHHKSLYTSQNQHSPRFDFTISQQFAVTFGASPQGLGEIEASSTKSFRKSNTANQRRRWNMKPISTWMRNKWMMGLLSFGAV